jgi:hypothetical protein
MNFAFSCVEFLVYANPCLCIKFHNWCLRWFACAQVLGMVFFSLYLVIMSGGTCEICLLLAI